MPTKLRLGLSLSSIRRVFGPGDEGNRILTQALENLVTQNGRFIVQQGETTAGEFQIGDALITQDGNLIALNQNIFQILVANGDVAVDEVAEAALDLLMSQASEIILTQDDKQISLNHDPETTGSSIISQDGSFIITQDGQPLITEQAS